MNTEFSDIIKLTQIPKECRSVNTIIPQLPWISKDTGKTTKSTAKILAISGKYN